MKAGPERRQEWEEATENTASLPRIVEDWNQHRTQMQQTPAAAAITQSHTARDEAGSRVGGKGW